MAKVVNVRKADKRSYVYIGRPSQWGNPYTVDQYGRGGAIAKFKEAMDKRTDLYQWLAPLRGQDLGCYCAPQPCHGDMILHWLDTHPVTVVPWPEVKVGDRVIGRTTSGVVKAINGDVTCITETHEILTFKKPSGTATIALRS